MQGGVGQSVTVGQSAPLNTTVFATFPGVNTLTLLAIKLTTWCH